MKTLKRNIITGSCLNAVSRLKGIETEALIQVMKAKVKEFECSFPFEGN